MATKQLPAARNGDAPAPAERAAGFLDLLDRSRGEIAKLLPGPKQVDRVLRVARTAYQMNADIRKCEPLSILSAVMKSCELGLDPGGALGHAYLIPYGRECQFQVGYKGMLKLARRSGAFKDIGANVVRQRDEFRDWYDPRPRMEFAPFRDGDAGPIRLAYAYAVLASGETTHEVMTAVEIEEIRKRHVRGNSPAWRDYPGEQYKKTVLKRFLKRQDCSVELAEAIEHDNREYDLGDVTPGRGALPPGASRSEALLRRLEPPAEPEFAADEGVREPLRCEADEPGGFDETTEPVDRSEGT